MAKHLQFEMDQLKRNLLSLSGLVEEAVGKAVKSLYKDDVELAKKVIESDNSIDLIEVQLEEDCLKILALHQPVAVDLRFIISALKINNDLERVADLATNIAQRTVSLHDKKRSNPPLDIETMASKVRFMLKKALDALVKMDSQIAREVCLSDGEIDEMHRISYQVIAKEIKKTPNDGELLLEYLSISRYLERIADYATNISEDIIYLVDGDIVRHHLEDDR